MAHACHDRYLIVHMIWFGHLTLVLTAIIIVHLYLAYYYSLISVHIFIVLFMILIISSFIHSLSCCTHCLLYTITFLFLTHSLICFLTTLNLHIQILNILFFDRFHWDRTCCEELESLPILALLPSFIPAIILWILYIRIASIPFLIPSEIMCIYYLYYYSDVDSS